MYPRHVALSVSHFRNRHFLAQWEKLGFWERGRVGKAPQIEIWKPVGMLERSWAYLGRWRCLLGHHDGRDSSSVGLFSKLLTLVVVISSPLIFTLLAPVPRNLQFQASQQVQVTCFQDTNLTIHITAPSHGILSTSQYPFYRYLITLSASQVGCQRYIPFSHHLHSEYCQKRFSSSPSFGLLRFCQPDVVFCCFF